jgi:hypothetical protein
MQVQETYTIGKEPEPQNIYLESSKNTTKVIGSVEEARL